MVTYHPQWIKVRDLMQSGAIGTLSTCRARSPISTSTPTTCATCLTLGGGALPDIGVYPTVSTRFVTGKEPKRVQATIERDQNSSTDIYSSIRADFGDFELSFYLSTQLANRQLMVFHGDKGFIEVHAPFNAGLYDHHRVELHNQNHTEATVFRFPGTQQYRLQVEAFARAAQGAKDAGLHAGEFGEEPEGDRRDLPRRRQRRLGEGLGPIPGPGYSGQLANGRDRQSWFWQC